MGQGIVLLLHEQENEQEVKAILDIIPCPGRDEEGEGIACQGRISLSGE